MTRKEALNIIKRMRAENKVSKDRQLAVIDEILCQLSDLN